MAKETTQSVEEMHLLTTDSKRTLGIANGKYEILDNIEDSNDEIEEMFGVK